MLLEMLGTMKETAIQHICMTPASDLDIKHGFANSCVDSYATVQEIK
jgi:hypothetical protein